MTEPSFAVSEFVAVLNQTLEYTYPTATINGELANFKVSKNRWVYFDLKDETATVRFFGTVYQLPGPLEDGMMLEVRGAPRLHPQFGFSVNILSMRPTGEGSIKKAAVLLEKKLAIEGLFDPGRKRSLPYPPKHIGLITSAESAAYRDFIKVTTARWRNLQISLIDVQVQGESAPAQLGAAIEQFNLMPEPPEVIVLTRGGGSAEDLQAFNTEHVTRAVAASRIPTLVAIGHEVDISLAELAADQRASTPSNAAELLVPDRRAVLATLKKARKQLGVDALQVLRQARRELLIAQRELHDAAENHLKGAKERLRHSAQLLNAFSPHAALARGYALIRKQNTLIRSGKKLLAGDMLAIDISDAHVTAEVKRVTMEES